MKTIIAYAIGVIFGVGISISGMANPAKVLNFFDVFGTWDPSLIFVMGGGLITALIGYWITFRNDQPMFEQSFFVPSNSTIDARLIGGSAVFGIGWGIAGFCPGGAIPAIGTGRIEVFIFMAALIVGILFAKFIQSTGAGTTAAKA